MTRKDETSTIERHNVTVFLGSQKFTYLSVENAIEALGRSGIIKDNAAAGEIPGRPAVRLCAELLETWP